LGSSAPRAVPASDAVGRGAGPSRPIPGETQDVRKQVQQLQTEVAGIKKDLLDKTDRESWTKKLEDTEAGLKAKINELSDRIEKLKIIRRANESLDLSGQPQERVRFDALLSPIARDAEQHSAGAGDATPASLAQAATAIV